MDAVDEDKDREAGFKPRVSQEVNGTGNGNGNGLALGTDRGHELSPAAHADRLPPRRSWRLWALRGTPGDLPVGSWTQIVAIAYDPVASADAPGRRAPHISPRELSDTIR